MHTAHVKALVPLDGEETKGWLNIHELSFPSIQVQCLNRLKVFIFKETYLIHNRCQRGTDNGVPFLYCFHVMIWPIQRRLQDFEVFIWEECINSEILKLCNQWIYGNVNKTENILSNEIYMAFLTF